MESLCDSHQEEIELICNHPQCKQPLLCLLCFQEHSKHCPANFKSDIKRVKTISKDEKWVHDCKQKRETLISQIEDLQQLRNEIHNENQKLMNQKFIDITNMFELKHLIWSNSLSELTKHANHQSKSDNSQDLHESLEALRKLDFSHDNHVERIKCAKDLETIIDGKVKPLLEQTHDPCEQVRLNKERLEKNTSILFEYLQKLNLKNLLKEGPNLEPIQAYAKVEDDTEPYNNANEAELKAIQDKNQLLQKQKREALEQRAQIQRQLAELQEENRSLHAQNNTFQENPLNRDREGEFQNAKNNINNINDLAEKMKSLNEEVQNLQKSLNAPQPANKNIHSEMSSPEILRRKPEPQDTEISVFNSVDNLDSALNNLDYSIIPINRFNVESKIMDSQHCETLYEWVSQSQAKKFQLKMIYQATRDGFTANSFHEKCDDQGATISLIKSKDHGRIFGGYTTKSWRCNGRGRCVADSDAFVFSLTHNEKYHCHEPQHAIYTHPKFLMVFGVGGDIGIKDNAHTDAECAWTNFPFRYQCEKLKDVCHTIANCHLAGSEKFTVEEIEVYQVVLHDN